MDEIKDRVLEAIRNAGRPISVEEIAVQTDINVDIVVRVAAELIEQRVLRVHTKAPVEELELLPA